MKNEENEIYVLSAYRWGQRNNHSYILASFRKKDKAISVAESHADYRGGKYSVFVEKIVIDAFDNEAKDYSIDIHVAAGRLLDTGLTGCELIEKERDEQLKKHHYINDSQYKDGELVRAACAICYDSEEEKPATFSAPNWAWEIREKKQAKANERIERLKVAGALIAAEIDRLNKS